MLQGDFMLHVCTPTSVHICMTAIHRKMCDLKQEATKSQARSPGHQMVGRTTDIYVVQSSMALLLIN